MSLKPALAHPPKHHRCPLLRPPVAAQHSFLRKCRATPASGPPAPADDAENTPKQINQPQPVDQPQLLPSDPTPPADQQPLWWVEQFEARRQRLGEQQQQQQQETGSSTQASPPAAPQQQQQQQQQEQRQAAASSRQLVNKLAWPTLQLLQLLVTVAALILWPASLYRTGLYSSKVWLLFWTYILFFGGGTVWRMAQFGPLASRSKDQQAKSLGTRAAWLLFVLMMPVLHWGCIGSFMKAKAAAAAAAAQQGAANLGAEPVGLLSSLTLYDVMGLSLLAGAVALNFAASRQLGKAYDRVVQPESLVTTGPYAWVQHPIYSSYMMLFCGYASLLHCFGYALLALVVCRLYYKTRVALEADVLQRAFGEQYTQYQRKTKFLFVPFLL